MYINVSEYLIKVLLQNILMKMINFFIKYFVEIWSLYYFFINKSRLAVYLRLLPPTSLIFRAFHIG